MDSICENEMSSFPNGVSQIVSINDIEFDLIKALIYERVGINLGADKKLMVVGRLRQRLLHHGFASYLEYYRFVTSTEGVNELQKMIDALTTNETYFFREPEHFSFLKNYLKLHFSTNLFRCWSAACSSGEETYSLAMILASSLGTRSWELLGSDVNCQVLDKAKAGLYPMYRHEGISNDFLKRFCLKGTGVHHGSFLVNQALRERVAFKWINLKETTPDIGLFDVIFLRNILIYFDSETKQSIVNRVLRHLKPGGLFVISHTETLQGLNHDLTLLQPSIFCKKK